MLPQNKPDRIRILFDDHRLVANAGLILPATLALRLGLPQLLRKHLDLGGAPGRANTGDKMMTLVASALAGGDCIDDADVLRAGGTARVLGFTAKAPSTLGTFLRSFRWGHVRQLDRVSRELLARVWKAGAGPGDAPFTIDLDSTICETYGLAKAPRIQPKEEGQAQASRPDERWAMDFMSDELFDGRRIPILTLVDHFTRESLDIEVDGSMGGQRVGEALARLALQGRKPQTIAMDNGPEFTSKRLDQWAYLNGVEMDFSRPGKPTDNAMIEAFNARLREECLNESWFLSLEDTREKIEGWRRHYNGERPHGALENLAPQAFALVATAGVQ